MPLVFSQTASGQTFTIPVGVTNGMVLVSQEGATFQGVSAAERDNCVLRADYTNSYGYLFQPGTAGLQQITIKNCTLDCANHASVLCAVVSMTGYIAKVVLENVRIINVVRAGFAILNQTKLEARGLEIYCDAAAIQSTETSTQTFVDECNVYGGRAGFTLSDVGASSVVPGIDLVDYHCYMHYFQSPTYESATISSIAQKSVTVTSHVSADRYFADCLRLLKSRGTWDVSAGPLSFGEKWDRIEVPDGRWTYILEVQDTYRRLAPWRLANSWGLASIPTGETATVYSVVIGRYGYTPSANVLSLEYVGLWPTARWRTVEGTTVVLPTADRLDIIRHGIPNPAVRDVDSGGFHITDPALNPRMTRCTVEGGFSDQITVRGSGAVITDCSVSIGQDMGYTIDCTTGAQTYRNCSTDMAGVYGMVVLGGAATILDATLLNSGLHGEGVYGYGIAIDSSATVTLSIKRAAGNKNSTTSGNYTVPTPSTGIIRPRYRKNR